MPVLPNAKYEIIAQNIAAGNTAQDALRIAGYSDAWARQNSTRVTTRDDIRSRIVELLSESAKIKLVDAAALHRRWSEMFEADIGDIIESDTEKHRMQLKPIHEWPKIWRQMLSSVDVKELFEPSTDGQDKAWDKIGELVKMKFVEQTKLGELIGKHKAVDAFVKQQMDVNLKVSVEQVESKLSEARHRWNLIDSEPIEQHSN